MSYTSKWPLRKIARAITVSTAAVVCGVGTTITVGAGVVSATGHPPDTNPNVGYRALLILLMAVVGVFAILSTGYAADRLFRLIWPKPPAVDHDR